MLRASCSTAVAVERNIPVPMPDGVVLLADCIWSVEKLLAFPVGQ
jgi:predicted acyl esterase